MTSLCSRWIILVLIAYCNMGFCAETHCKDISQTVFNCHLTNSNTVISVCKIGTEASNQQYLQYVFGEVGKAELVFPSEESVQPDQFIFTRQYSSSAGYIEYGLAFMANQHNYNLYWAESSETNGVPKEKSEVWSGVRELTKTGKSIDFTCGEDIEQDLMSGVTTFVVNAKWVESP